MCAVPCDVNFIIWECMNRLRLLDHIIFFCFCACMHMWNACYRILIKVQNRLTIGWLNIAGRLHPPHVQMHDKAAPYTLRWWNLCWTQLQMCKNLRGKTKFQLVSGVTSVCTCIILGKSKHILESSFILFMLTAVCHTGVVPPPPQNVYRVTSCSDIW